MDSKGERLVTSLWKTRARQVSTMALSRGRESSGGKKLDECERSSGGVAQW